MQVSDCNEQVPCLAGSVCGFWCRPLACGLCHDSEGSDQGQGPLPYAGDSGAGVSGAGLVVTDFGAVEGGKVNIVAAIREGSGLVLPLCPLSVKSGEP